MKNLFLIIIAIFSLNSFVSGSSVVPSDNLISPAIANTTITITHKGQHISTVVNPDGSYVITCDAFFQDLTCATVTITVETKAGKLEIFDGENTTITGDIIEYSEKFNDKTSELTVRFE